MHVRSFLPNSFGSFEPVAAFFQFLSAVPFYHVTLGKVFLQNSGLHRSPRLPVYCVRMTTIFALRRAKEHRGNQNGAS
jgi:hypothetical protein